MPSANRTIANLVCYYQPHDIFIGSIVYTIEQRGPALMIDCLQ